MTQEISGYLLIRSFLLVNDTNELIEKAGDRESFGYIVKNIVQLIMKEDYFLITDDLIRKVFDFINYYRSIYINDKEINDNVNYIIRKLNEYKNMDFNTKKFLGQKWLKEEMMVRELPKEYQNIEVVLNLIVMDNTFTLALYGFNDSLVPTTNLEIIEYLSLVNLIMNRFPEMFEQMNILALIESFNDIKTMTGLDTASKKFLNKTINNLIKKQISNLIKVKKKKIETKKTEN